jgi:hypothetical protein
MIQVANISEHWLTSTRVHGATTQKTAIFNTQVFEKLVFFTHYPLSARNPGTISNLSHTMPSTKTDVPQSEMLSAIT